MNVYLIGNSEINMKKNNQQLDIQKKGFTLFIAMIVSGLILAVGFSIGNIILKELALGSFGKESQVAFYAADSMRECALYWDKKNAAGYDVGISPFATDTPWTNDADIIARIRCGTGVPGTGGVGAVGGFSKIMGDDSGVNNTAIHTGDLYATTTFYAVFKDLGSTPVIACAKATIIKRLNQTTIESRGYNADYSATANSGSGGCDTSSPKTIERGLRDDY